MEARQLDHSSSQAKDLLLIENFVQLQAALLSHEDFQKYAPSLNAMQDIELRKGPHLITVTAEPERTHALSIESFSENAIAIFGAQEAGPMPPSCVQYIYPNSNLAAVMALFENIFQLQGQFHIWKSQQKDIESTSHDVKQILSISRILNGERNLEKLLSLILKKAREVTGADAGSIYTLEKPSNKTEDWTLHFRYTQNDSITHNLSKFSMPVSEKSIVGNVVIHKQAINIPDLYQLSQNPADNPYGAKHDKSWDQRIGYESHSMLSLPVFNIAHEVTGVIQLINRKNMQNTTLKTHDDFTTQVIPFDERDVEYGLIVGQQAGIALENAAMTEEIQALFDGFVNASVTAIEQRDPTTSGHSHRVAALTLNLAKIIDRTSSGIYTKVKFTNDELREIEYASLLHDFGKLGVSEQVLVKAKKLYPWEFEIVTQRFEYIRAMIEIEYLNKRIEYLENPVHFPDGYDVHHLLHERDDKIKRLVDFTDFVKGANEPTILEQGGFERLNDIAGHKFCDLHGKSKPYLLDNELAALSVAKGSLTREEFSIIQSHVTHTYEFLRKIPWGTRLANIPNIAAKHHEYLNGSGYPHGARGEQIPIQARMMTIADIFDALTAADRPYKRSLPFEKALDILQMEVKSGKVDGQLLEVFIESKAFDVIKAQ